jgi:glucose 1-dehydrogenase
MSKAGLAMMTREMAFEFSKFGITINSITPGAIRTDINREVLSDPAYEAKVLAKIPAGFIGDPADVAALVAFLASDRARYITGASLFIDGGMAL